MKKRKSSRRAPVAQSSVFVVDDNALLVEFASTVLTAAGYNVRHFCDPKAVLLALTQADPKPSVLVTDYDMGEMNGLDLIVSSHKIHPSLKTVLLSGTVDGSITQSHSAKVNCFLGKPYNPAQLQNVVSELLKT